VRSPLRSTPSPLLTHFCRLGTVAWNGEPLRSGTRLFIGGKEVELDNKIPASQVPGTSAIEEDNADDVDVDLTTPVTPKAGGVSASSFYAPMKSTKPKGPMYVDIEVSALFPLITHICQARPRRPRCYCHESA
jgi:hypothetical protein